MSFTGEQVKLIKKRLYKLLESLGLVRRTKHMSFTGEQMKLIRNQIYLTWQELLESLGLVRRTKDLHTYALDSEVYGTIELLVRTKGHLGMADFTPMVGIWHPTVDALQRELPVPWKRGRWDPHVLTRLEFIAANSKALGPLFTDDLEAGIPKVLEQIAQSVKANAIPWWRKHQDLSRLARTVKEDPETFEHALTLPVVYLALGQRKDAEKVMRLYAEYEEMYPHFYESIRARFERRE